MSLTGIANCLNQIKEEIKKLVISEIYKSYKLSDQFIYLSSMKKIVIYLSYMKRF